MSILKPEGSMTLGLATAALVYGVYSFSLPSTAVMHASDPHDRNIDAGRKKAAWTSVIAVAGISLITKDKNIFILGGAMVAALDWHARLANASHPETGELVSNTGYEPATSDAQVPAEAPLAGQAAY